MPEGHEKERVRLIISRTYTWGNREKMTIKQTKGLCRKAQDRL